VLNLSTIRTVFAKELRELLRDRRSLMVMFGVPLLLYPLLFLGVGKLTQSKAKEQAIRPAKVVVQNADAAPELLRRLNLPENLIVLDTGTASDARLQKGEIDVVLTVPYDAERLLLSPPSTSPTTTANAPPPAPPEFLLRVDRSRSEADPSEQRLRNILQSYERWILEQRLQSKGLTPDLLSPLKRTTTDIATQDQRLGRFLGQLLPLLLLVTGMLGAFFPALNATTTERELGTLETLLVTPVSRTELLLAKGLLVLGCSILTAGLNMASMSMVFANIAGNAKEQLGAVSINAPALALAFLATIPALVLFSAIVMWVGLVARTYREANSFAAPVMMLPMAAMAIGLADPASTQALMATPIANTTLIIRDILTSRVTLPNFLLAAGSNLLFATVVLSITARLFTNEQLVNPSWEPLSLKGFKRSKRPGWPTLDAALVLVASSVLIQFYAGPSIGRLYTSGAVGVIGLLGALMTASFILPTLLLSLLARYPLRSVLSLRAAPVLALVAAVLLGYGLMPLSMAYSQLQSHLFPVEPSDASRNVAQLIGTGFKDSNPWLIAAAFGIFPGIAEELLFRGVVLSALRKKFSTHTAVWVSALLFALIHFDLAGLPIRTVLGAALGYITVRSGSIFPAILLHATFNFSQIGLLALYAPDLLSASPPSTTQPSTLPTLDAIPSALQPTSPQSLLRLAAALASTTFALLLLRALPQPTQPTTNS